MKLKLSSNSIHPFWHCDRCDWPQSKMNKTAIWWHAIVVNLFHIILVCRPTKKNKGKYLNCPLKKKEEGKKEWPKICRTTRFIQVEKYDEMIIISCRYLAPSVSARGQSTATSTTNTSLFFLFSCYFFKVACDFHVRSRLFWWRKWKLHFETVDLIGQNDFSI